MTRPKQYPEAFRDLLRAVDVSTSHLDPKHPASFAGTIAQDSIDVVKGLAIAYDVEIRVVLRAALVIGIEELLGTAEELGHYGAKKTPA